MLILRSVASSHIDEGRVRSDDVLVDKQLERHVMLWIELLEPFAAKSERTEVLVNYA